MLDPDAVRLPDQRAVAGGGEVAGDVGIAAIQPGRIRPDHLDPVLDQPAGGRGAEARVVVPVALGAEVLVLPEPQAHDLARAERGAGALDGGGQLVRLDPIARLVAPQVDDDAGREEVLELELVDRPRGPALGGRVVVPRRVDVGARVSGEGEPLGADADAVHVLRLGTEHELALRERVGVALVLDLGGEDGAHPAPDLPRIRLLDRHAQVHEAQVHRSLSPSHMN